MQGAENKKLTGLLTDMMMEKAMNDKLAMYEAEQSQENLKSEVKKSEEDREKEGSEEGSDYDSEEERIIQSLREKRVQEMKAKYNVEAQNRMKGHGVYSEIEEEQFLNVVTKSEFSSVHFYHQDFERCKIIDMHLKDIAHHHPQAKFVKLNAEKAPFFVKKLQIQVLPTIVFFKDGVAIDRIIGFEELGGQDDFHMITLARRIVKSGIIKPKLKGEDGRMVLQKGKQEESDSGSDDD